MENSRIKKSKYKSARRKETLSLTLLFLPGALLLFVFKYLPIPGIIIAFKSFNPNKGIWGSAWNGLKNFEFFFTSQDATRVIRNTLSYSFAFLILDVICGVLVAVLFYNLRSKKALKIYNTIIILPRFMSSVMIAFIVYIILNPSYGLLNQLLVFLGAEKVSWYTEPAYWPVILTVTHIWQVVGMKCIMFYASLMALDETLIEAAKLDGANKLQQTMHVMVPHLVPIMVITTILGMGSLFDGDFGLFYQTPKNIGLLFPTTDVISTYTYRALSGGAIERSAAVGLFQSVAGLIMVLATNAIVRKFSPENSIF